MEVSHASPDVSRNHYASRGSSAADAPITSNPIGEPIVKGGISVEVKDIARLPDTHRLRPAGQDVAPGARELARGLHDDRRFANDYRWSL
jgi:hypothetical protein